MSSLHFSPVAAMEAVPQQALPLSAGPIIVATDGSPESDAAIVAAQLLAAHTDAPVQIVSVLEPIVIPSMGWDATPISPDVYVHRRAALREAIHEQLRRLGPAKLESTVSLVDGDTAPVLARMAHEQRARLLLLGRGRHGVVDRLLMGETVLRVLQLADVPVLAAEAGISALPRRVLIATDFSPYSLYAARVALSIADPDATFYLAHVVPRPEQFTPGLESLTEGNGVATAFDRMRTEIGAENRRVETAILNGHPGRALVDFASSKNVDLVVSGTHGYGFFNKLILGSVAMQLVRGASCSVLAVPGSAAVRAATRDQAARGRTRSIPASDWSKALAEFTRRNASRPSTVEIENPELGAQVQGNALPLVGAAYDPHGSEVQLMFGAAGLAGRHLSHVIADVSAIEILTDLDGPDRALRVSNGDGSTLVTFVA